MNNNDSIRRKRINSEHPVVTFGGLYRLLNDSETLKEDDETACVSMLLWEQGDRWICVMPEWEKDLGKAIGEILDPKTSKDADCNDRLFRRKVN